MYTIRKGVKKDLGAVRRLVQELAAFEKEPEAVTASLADYEKSFSDGDFEIVLAESAEGIIGMALYYMCFSTWKGKMLYLEDFIVTDKCRGQGVGDALYKAFLIESRRKGAVLNKWEVIDWNESAIRFYEKRGAAIEKMWYNCKVFN